MWDRAPPGKGTLPRSVPSFQRGSHSGGSGPAAMRQAHSGPRRRGTAAAAPPRRPGRQRGRRSCFFERQQAAAERRAAGLHVQGAASSRRHTRDTERAHSPRIAPRTPGKSQMAAALRALVAGRALAQGAGGPRRGPRGAPAAGPRGRRQGCEQGRTGGWGRAGDPGRTTARLESQGQDCVDRDGAQGQKTEMATGMAGCPVQGPGRGVLQARSRSGCTCTLPVLAGAAPLCLIPAAVYTHSGSASRYVLRSDRTMPARLKSYRDCHFLP